VTDRDPADQPEEPTWGLVVPFTACTSKGGPYEDQAFVAGFQCGEIDKALTVIAAAGGERATFTVRTPLVPQLELLAMNRGFPVMAAIVVEDYPEWTVVGFATSNASADAEE